MGFKPMTKYFTASKISENKAYEILKERANDSDSDFYCCALFTKYNINNIYRNYMTYKKRKEIKQYIAIASHVTFSL